MFPFISLLIAVLCFAKAIRPNIGIRVGHLTHPGANFPSRNPAVVMVQPTENWNGNNGLNSPRLIDSTRIYWIRNTPDALMGTDVIEVVNVFTHQSLQVALTENDDVIEALASDTADEALTDGIGFRRTHRCLEDINVAGNSREMWTKLIIMVSDQESWSFLKRSSIAPLLSNPGIAWRPSDAKVNYPPRFQLNNEEDEYRAEEHIIGLHKIAGPHLAGVVLQKRRPSLSGLSWRQVTSSLLHILADRALVDPVTQLAQFIADPFGTPRSILDGHLLDQGDGFWRKPGPA